MYSCHYKIFRSDHVANCKVSTVDYPVEVSENIPHSDHAQLHSNPDFAQSTNTSVPDRVWSIHCSQLTTGSGQIVQPSNFTNEDLTKRFAEHNKKRFLSTRNPLRKDGLIDSRQ